MRINLNERMLSLPFYANASRLALYLHLLLIADETGCITATEGEMRIATGILLPTIVNGLKEFQRLGLLTLDSDLHVYQLTDCRYWQHEKARRGKEGDASKHRSIEASPSKQRGNEASQRNIDSSTQKRGIEASPIIVRIAAFKARFWEELQTWLSKQRDTNKGKVNRIFPKEEQEAFLEYWTAYAPTWKKFKAEKEKDFFWQLRLSTWMSSDKQDRYLRKAHSTPEQQQCRRNLYDDQEAQARKRDEEQQRFKEHGHDWLQGKPEGMNNIEWIHELRKRAANGDQEAKDIIEKYKLQ